VTLSPAASSSRAHRPAWTPQTASPAGPCRPACRRRRTRGRRQTGPPDSCGHTSVHPGGQQRRDQALTCPPRRVLARAPHSLRIQLLREARDFGIWRPRPLVHDVLHMRLLQRCKSRSTGKARDRLQRCAVIGQPTTRRESHSPLERAPSHLFWKFKVLGCYKRPPPFRQQVAVQRAVAQPTATCCTTRPSRRPRGRARDPRPSLLSILETYQ
jgi:hypothetical protein